MRSQKMYSYHPDLKIPYQEDLLITGSLLFGIGITNLYTPFPEAKKSVNTLCKLLNPI